MCEDYYRIFRVTLLMITVNPVLVILEDLHPQGNKATHCAGGYFHHICKYRIARYERKHEQGHEDLWSNFPHYFVTA